jgi:hypothetical protein
MRNVERYGGFLSYGGSQNGWFISTENPMFLMEDWGIPPV